MKHIAFVTLFAGIASTAHAADPFSGEPAATGPRLSGYGEFYLGGLNIRSETGGVETDNTVWSLGGAARVNMPFGDRWNLQADVTADHIASGKHTDDATAVGGALHAYWRDPNAYAVGAFATLSEFSSENGDATTWTFGPEAQIYLDNLTLYGQIYYGQMDMDLGVDPFDVLGARAVARYFVQPNVRIDGELGYRNSNWEVGSFEMDVGTISTALQANYRFDSTPLTVFGRYQLDTSTMAITSFDDTKMTSHKFVVGLRASFGSETLFEEDRRGATMDTARSNYLTF